MVEKRLIFIVGAVILFTFSIINFFSLIHFTGSAVSTNTGETQICIDGPPTITGIADQTATSGSAFTVTVTATDGDDTALTFYDNTSLFAIGASTGIISFTPSSSQVGTQDILITVEDDAGCLAHNSTDAFTMIINAAAAAAAEAAAAPAAGAGGGGGGAPPKKMPPISFELSEEIVKVTLPETQSLDKKIRVKNTGKLNVSIEIENPLSPLVEVFPHRLDLNTGEEKEVTFVFNPSREARPNVYTASVSFRGLDEASSVVRQLVVVLEIESDEVLFDASVDLPKKTLLPGEDLKAAITLVDLRRRQSPADVKLLYAITDVQGNRFYEEEELTRLEGQASFSKTIPLSITIPTGDYVFSMKVIFDQSFATATELFRIEAPFAGVTSRLAKPFAQPSVLLLIPLLVVLVAVIFVILYFTHRRIGRQKVRTVVEQKIIKERIIKEKIVPAEDRSAVKNALKRKLLALEEGYKRGYITEQSYLRAKEHLKELLRRG